MPVPGQSGNRNSCCKNQYKEYSDGHCTQGLSTGHQLKSQRLFFRADFNAAHTRRAFKGIDPRFLPNVDIAGADSFTLAAINAMGWLSMNSSQAEKSDDSQQRAVWTQVPAPEIPNNDSQTGQHNDNNKI